MKIAFTKAVSYTPDWNDNKSLPDNEQLKVSFKRLRMAELIKISADLKAGGFSEKMDDANLSLDQMATIVKIGEPLLPSHATLEHADGFNLEDVVSYAEFFPLAVELLFHLITVSQPTKADEKN